jgi:hypothetical protein
MLVWLATRMQGPSRGMLRLPTARSRKNAGTASDPALSQVARMARTATLTRSARFWRGSRTR